MVFYCLSLICHVPSDILFSSNLHNWVDVATMPAAMPRTFNNKCKFENSINAKQKRDSVNPFPILTKSFCRSLNSCVCRVYCSASTSNYIVIYAVADEQIDEIMREICHHSHERKRGAQKRIHVDTKIPTFHRWIDSVSSHFIVIHSRTESEDVCINNEAINSWQLYACVSSTITQHSSKDLFFTFARFALCLFYAMIKFKQSPTDNSNIDILKYLFSLFLAAFIAVSLFSRSPAPSRSQHIFFILFIWYEIDASNLFLVVVVLVGICCWLTRLLNMCE